MSFLASLSLPARDELRVFVFEAVREALAARERREARREWLTTAEVAELISSSENAVRCRLRRGWLAGDVARDGKRLLVRRRALLDELDRRAGVRLANTGGSIAALSRNRAGTVAAAPPRPRKEDLP